MVTNKFATMLRRNTNKITFVLLYAILEWILIILLLSNSLFSYFIIKFSDYFGLKTPCIWCTRIDHIIDPAKNKNFCRDLVCESHAVEISKLGFCSTHHKLVESKDMCVDCSSSSHLNYSQQNFGFFPWMKQLGMIKNCDDNVTEKGEESLRCSCCGVILDNRLYPPCILVKPAIDILDYEQKQKMMEGVFISEGDEGDHSDHSRSDFALDHHEDQQRSEENKGIHMVFEGGRKEEEDGESCACSVCDYVKENMDSEIYKLDLVVEKEKEEILNVSKPKDDDDDDDDQTCEKTEEIPQKHLEFFIHGDDCRLVPVELVDPDTIENGNQSRYNKVEAEGLTGSDDFILDFDMSNDAEAEPVKENWHISGDIVGEFLSQENINVSKVNEVESDQIRTRGQSSELQQVEENFEQNYHDLRFDFAQTAEDFPKNDNVKENMEKMIDVEGEQGEDVSLASEDASQTHGEEFEAEVSIGTDIPDHEQVDGYQDQDTLLDTNQQIQEDSPTNDSSGNDKGEEFLEFKGMSLEVRMPTVSNHMPLSFELNENEEGKVPDTPTSLESLHQLHKKLLLLERKESGTEESLDGSVISDIEYGEVTTEKLISALKSERKALKTLYAELEEERNASAIAANQTMEMINRLQEEKAAMQMEALQYQRMMDEQSEFDQEALQLLNELMMKSEKEKQELEKELEVYRKKVHEYEVREKIILSRSNGSMRSRTSSPSCSNAEDSDELSIDSNHEAKEENGFYNNQECSNQNTPVDAVLCLEESLSNFEEERLSILEQLKVLEEKLIILSYEEEEEEEEEEEKEEHFYDDTVSIEHLSEENGNGYHDRDDHQGQVNGFENGNGKHHQGKKINGVKAKRLLPLFDETTIEAEDEELNGDENEVEFSNLQKNSDQKVNNLDKKKHALEEEVNHVYERLQLLESDREFLKHCLSSLRKGDKGLHLLQEILQHLRDLRNVELRAKNMEDLLV